MPIGKGSASYSRFKVLRDEKPKDPRRSLANAFKKGAFEELSPDAEEDRSAGWVEIDDSDATTFASGSFTFGEQVIVSWRVDQLKVPSALLRAQVDRWARGFQAEKGRAAARTEKREQKDLLQKQLRRRAFPVSRTHDVSWNLSSDELYIWSTSRKTVEEIIEALEDGLGLKLRGCSPGALSEAADVSDLMPTDSLFGDGILGMAGL